MLTIKQDQLMSRKDNYDLCGLCTDVFDSESKKHELNTYFKLENFLVNDEIVVKIKDLLGLDFYGLKDYFKNIFFEFCKNQNTVLVTRRCYLLAIWFMNYIIKYDDSVNKEFNIENQKEYIFIKNSKTGTKNYIFSDRTNTHLIGIINSGAEIKVVDDVCIHGRSLSKIKDCICRVVNNITKLDNSDKVKSYVYLYSNEANIVKPDKSYAISDRAGWRNLSQNIVKVINYLNFPYVSYLNSFTITNVNISMMKSILCDLSDKLICKEFGQSDYRNDLGKSSYFIIEKKITKLRHEYLKCIRLYYNKTIKSLLIIPYVILNSITDSIKDKSSLLALLSQYLTENAASSIANALSASYNFDSIDNSDENNNKYSFLYNLISCIASQAYGFYFNRHYLKCASCDIRLWEYDIINCLTTGFGVNIAKIIKKENNYVKHVNGDYIIIEDFNQRSFAKYSQLINNMSENIWHAGEDPLYVVDNNVVIEKNLIKYIENNCRSERDKYMLLCGIIDMCDMGRLNVFGDLCDNECVSVMKPGELGFLSAINSNRDLYSDPKYRRLLSNQYYRLLLS